MKTDTHIMHHSPQLDVTVVTTVPSGCVVVVVVLALPPSGTVNFHTVFCS